MFDITVDLHNNILILGAASAPDPAVDEIKVRLSSVKHKILVLSGKGGVGKSTFTATLARGLAQNEERQVAVLDVDICGPSQPRLMGLQGEQVRSINEKLTLRALMMRYLRCFHI